MQYNAFIRGIFLVNFNFILTAIEAAVKIIIIDYVQSQFIYT